LCSAAGPAGDALAPEVEDGADGEPGVDEEPEVARAALPAPTIAAHTPPAIAIFFHMQSLRGFDGIG
jgi:hypothetical protein